MTLAHRIPSPRALELLDRHFTRRNIGAIVGDDDPTLYQLLRQVTYEPLAEMLSRPGKAIRARMVELAHGIVCEFRRPREAPPLHPDLPHVLELLHAGSLIVDDIEDRAELRRGQPTLHRIVGDARAINAGNFLYFLPTLLLDEMGLHPHAVLALHRAFSRQVLRCHHGQAVDLSVRVSNVPRDEVREVVEASAGLKTGALFELAFEVGVIAAEGGSVERDSLLRFARNAGIALQMMDDLTSVVVRRRRDKGLEDLLAERPTWVWAELARLCSNEEYAAFTASARRVAREQEDANALLSKIAAKVAPSADLPSRRWRGAVRTLREELGPLAAIDRLVGQLQLLEQSYGS